MKATKAKNLSALVLIIFFLFIVAGVVYYFVLLPKFNQNKSGIIQSSNSFGWKFPITKFPEVGAAPGPLAYSSIRDPGGIPSGLPVRLQIPVIGVDSSIEDALITSDGRMDVPAGAADVAWFSLGPQPGQVGSAVIGGHYGVSNGIPWVFANLNKVKVGDKIYIINDEGDTLAFVVRMIKLFDQNADATPVFTSTDGLAHLNLITCEGIWNQVNGTYPSRLVLFTDQIKSEGVAPATTLSMADFPRSLSVGATGTDVIALQTALEQRGFLIIPPGITTGLFGGLTRSAVEKYQTSVGLPPIGVFGSLTRAKLISELATNSVLPNAGIANIVTQNSTVNPSNFFQVCIQLLQSLYATVIDGIITSCLILAILFLAFKIISRLYYQK